MNLADEVKQSVTEVREAFPDADVEVATDGQGGAWVTVADVDLGPAWVPTASWLGFHILHNYPYSDVYPHFVDGDAQLAAGGLPKQAVTPCTYAVDQRPALQVSRRSNRWDPNLDTAALKALKVIDWLQQQ